MPPAGPDGAILLVGAWTAGGRAPPGRRAGGADRGKRACHTGCRGDDVPPRAAPPRAWQGRYRHVPMPCVAGTRGDWRDAAGGTQHEEPRARSHPSAWQARVQRFCPGPVQSWQRACVTPVSASRRAQCGLSGGAVMAAGAAFASPAESPRLPPLPRPPCRGAGEARGNLRPAPPRKEEKSTRVRFVST